MSDALSAFVSIADAPLDTDLPPDVGDAPGASQSLTEVSPHPSSRRAIVPVPVIPFVRVIRLGSVGKDVEGAKRAIWRSSHTPYTDLTQTFGAFAVKQLTTFQAAHGLRADGQLGPATLAKLAPFFDSYAFLLYTGFPPGGDSGDMIRKAIVAYQLWGYNQREQIHYVERRPMDHMDDLYRLPIYEDCSTFATKGYKFGGAPDPNNLHYDGLGNTTTMLAHGRSVSIGAARPGDLVLYRGHVATLVMVGSAPRVVSLGSEPGPYLLAWDYRSDIVSVRTYF